MPHPKCEFSECVDCINKEFDPFRCETCIDGSNFEDKDDDSEELTYAEFIGLFKEAA
jgi:hypothetical protein